MTDNKNQNFTILLSESDDFVETLIINNIEAQPGMVELTVKTQLLTAKNPDELHVKFRACIKQSRLQELGVAIDEYLKVTAGSFIEPIRR